MTTLFAAPLLILGQVPDPTNSLPAWLTGGGLAAILVYLLIRAEKRNDVLLARVDALNVAHDKAVADLHVDYGERLARNAADCQHRLDERDERYRAMAERTGDRLYAGLDALAQAAKLVQAIEPKGTHGDRAGES